jgi:2-dehydropantoate 2-reductase
VWAYDVSEEHVAAMNAHGLRLTGHAELTAAVNARTDPDDIPPCSFGIVATKGMFTRRAIEATRHLFDGVPVCSVQNGIGNEEVIAEHVPRVMRGVTLPAARVTEPGVVRMHGGGRTWIGPFEPRTATMEEVRDLGELIDRSGMELNGGVVDAGAACGVPTPLNGAIAALITGLEESWPR